ncbi:unnamed protein product [Blepharisma stoltei]|uniref:Nucleoplasmin-like domain-containing protein n=1 Tax=Blepharisma stoltei TaxID=1481888 RepID=A0AAU9JWY9_9CILI|nr:unnamed protein product [Blepharisma stoltei]
MIWSITISANKSYSIENETARGELLHITKLSLDSQSSSTNVFVSIDFSKYPIANLGPSKRFLKTDLCFNTLVPAILTVEGPGEVIILGNLEPISLSHTPYKLPSEVKSVDLPVKRPPAKLQPNTQISKKAKISDNNRSVITSSINTNKKPINKIAQMLEKKVEIKTQDTKTNNRIASNQGQDKKKQEINSKIKKNNFPKQINERRTKFLEIKERMEQWRGAN